MCSTSNLNMSMSEELLSKNAKHEMLEFETQIFLEVLQKDGLVVAAKGLCLDRVLLNIFEVYRDPGNLVLVLNCTDVEEKYFMNKLDNQYVHSIKCDTNIAEREDVYLSGGIHFVTTRILVVDMLKKRIPLDKITGIVVFRAHVILESCQEAFAIRLFRRHNKTGFIKAFSNNAESFTMGFGHVERIMRTLFVKELYIWPRFHSTVLQSLKKFQPEVVELHIPISQKVKNIQTCILDLMNLTVKELKRINKTLELGEITVENCLTKQFHKILQCQMDCVWHQLNSKSKQLIADLKTLRHLIIAMLHADPVTFYSMVSEYRKVEYAQMATWVFLDPAELLFTISHSLVFSGDKELNPDFCPKWSALSEILTAEIPAHIKEHKITNNKILILCQDTKTCFQLHQYLVYGPHHYLFLMALKNGVKFKSIDKNFKHCEALSEKFSQKESQTKDIPEKRSKQLKIGKLNNDVKNQIDCNLNEDIGKESECEDYLGDLKSSYILNMSQTMCRNLNETDCDEDINNSQYAFEPFSQMENMNLTQICQQRDEKPDPKVLIQTFTHSSEFMCLQETLEELKPNFIIMYHCNMGAVRQIELYEAHRTRDTPLKVFFLIHAETVEEQSYLTSLRREKEAFEYLIETKSTMTIPEDQDGKSEECLTLQFELRSPTKNTRHGGKTDVSHEKRIVIVDMREFRSELPALIHKRGIDIEPVTITIGDYILTPDICVERKSLSDLVGSLNSGRLYQQCTQMTRYYSKPMLLIEFNQNRPFSWQNNYMISSESNSFDIQEKLLLLTLHFPKLKIVWSASPYASAQLFEELKEGKDQPSLEYAIAVAGEQDSDLVEMKYNVNIYDFVQKLPGITSKNIDAFLRRGGKMAVVVKKSEDELKEMLGNSLDAKCFYSIIHEEHKMKESNNVIKQKSRSRQKFTYLKK